MWSSGSAAAEKDDVSGSSAPTTSTNYVTSVVQSLKTRLSADVDINVISAEVEAAFAAYSMARITQFVPILVENRVRARLCRG